jgi:hypothetical protein
MSDLEISFAREASALEERKLVVAWLRREARKIDFRTGASETDDARDASEQAALETAAEAIARGEHDSD